MKIEKPSLSYIGYPNRYICTVLDEMRECLKNLNFAYFASLIEEVQMLANRMEASLEDKKDIRKLTNDIHKLKAIRKKLKKEVDKLIEKRK